MPKSLVVIPTVRNPDALKDYIINAERHRFELSKLFFLVLTEDFVDKSVYSKLLKDSGAEGLVMNQRDRDNMFNDLHLGEFSDVIPKHSHAETSFGLFFMSAHNLEYKQGFFIDDDTKPLDSIDYFSSHLRNLGYEGEILSLSSSTKWVNTLHHAYYKHRLYPRGYPYAAINESTTVSKERISKVVVSQGLWTNIPDLDAVRILMEGDLNGQSRTRLDTSDFGENFVAANGNYLTVCSMNLAFTNEIIPAFYQFKMDDNPWKIGRFDDIWSGVVAKKIADSFGWGIISGNPLCEHNKAPRSTFKDLRSEVPALESNERLYQVLDTIQNLEGDIFQRTEKIAATLTIDSDEFLRYSGKYLSRWLELLRRME